jgi:glycosyltransferase involved in cell wall biosynthesis
MNVLLVTDSFPPNCGGSGWSTYELARGLRGRGHRVRVVKASAGTRGAERTQTFDGFEVIDYRAFAPPVPGVRNYFKNERLYRRLGKRLERLIADEQIEIVHGQHVLSCVPAVEAAKRAGIPAVCTIRDYWPVCYRSDLIHSARGRELCPGCARAAGLHAGRPRIGLTSLATYSVRTYIASNLRRKQKALLDAGAVIAVSSKIGADLVERAPDLAKARILIIPNPVDTTELLQRAGPAPPMAGPYALYVGKLAPNKGTSYLVDVVRRAELDWPLVIVGDGPDRVALEKAAAHSGRDIRFTGWLDPAGTATWLSHASLLIFPSSGPESLSRVLIEASALGRPIAAMNTGGTPDVIRDEVTGLLSETPEELAGDVRRLRSDAQLRERLGAAAAAHAREQFEASSVVTRVEALYRELVSPQGLDYGPNDGTR